MKSTLLIPVLLFACQAIAQINDGFSWPQVIETDKGRVIVYQPHPERLEGDLLHSRAAISVKMKDDAEPTFGAIWLISYLRDDKEERTVSLESVEVSNIRLPIDVDSLQMNKFKIWLAEEMMNWHLILSYDQLLASLEEFDLIDNSDFQNLPPKIIWRKSPAVLVTIDGEPILKTLESKFQQVVNCPVFIVTKKNKFYLYSGNNWFRANELDETWKKLKNPPTILTKIERKYNFQDYDLFEEFESADIEIIISNEPTELIISEGENNFSPLVNGDLLFVDNNTADLFMYVPDQKYFLLLSGRWFVANSLDGPWSFSPAEDLPQVFSQIPEDSPKADVLASVPGTSASKEALLDAHIPQTAAINREMANASVTYDGEPNFEEIPGTNLSFAVNTLSSVFLSDKVYFLCDNAVWFHSDSPHGPWVVSDIRPKDIENLPPSNPNYNVKYVYIYEATPTVVYVGYTPGYVGCYAYGPTVVYGTGFYYHPWHGAYYYPRPVTYGFSFRYSSYNGWSIGIGFGWGHAYYGPPYYRPPYYRPPYYRPPYHRPPPPSRPTRPDRPSTQPVNRTAGGRNLYANRHDVARPTTQPQNRPSTRPSQGNQRPGNTRPSTRPAQRPSNKMPNDVYTDRQGNVYKRSQNGSWQQRENKNWSKPQQRPSNQQLDKSYQSRQRGNQRTQNYNRSRPTGGRGRR